jgi:DNA-directed RNA polymerase specialized sigma24 family protein
VYFHNEQLRILKDLFLEYQKEPNEEIFLKIIERVDKMLAELVGKFSRMYYYTESTPQLLQDMYQAAVHSLEKAIILFKPMAKETSIPIWIFHTVRNELFKTYGVKRFDPVRYLDEHPDCQEKADNDLGLINEDIHRIIKNLIDIGEISEEDLELFNLVYVEKVSISEIFRTHGDKWGKSRVTIQKQVDQTRTILKREFREKGFGDD